jgi:hypothetical protein
MVGAVGSAEADPQINVRKRIVPGMTLEVRRIFEFFIMFFLI